MNKTGKRWICFLALLMCLCLLLTSCAPASQQPAGNSEVQVENLAKLCKVWGYVKYTHPVFLLGEKDWDEELLKLIPAVSEADSDEVNGILHEWVDSLGEVDYGTLNRVPLWAAAKEEEISVQADTSWISADYLGEELTQQLSQLGPVPNIDRSKAPVQFNQEGVPDFQSEKTDPNCSYQKEEERLLGLFRVWNVIEYYFPYIDVMDESWHDLLDEFIPKIVEENDRQGFELVLLEMTAHLHDLHTGIVIQNTLQDFWGEYLAPVNLIRTKEGEWIVCKVFGNCPLQVGDVILGLDGTEVKKIEKNREKYLSVPNEKKLYQGMALYLLRSKSNTMDITILRNEKEETYTVTGTKQYTNLSWKEEKSHEILEKNIGVINPSSIPEGDTESVVSQIMNDLCNTNGLIIDLRQYPSDPNMHMFLSMYLQKKGTVYSVMTIPSQSVPGTFINRKISSIGVATGAFYYEKPVVLLMDERSMSSSEFSIMHLRTGDHVVVIGSSSAGVDGNVTELPLPNGNHLRFTSFGVYTPEMGQTQRVGLAPDIEVYPTIEGIKQGRDELMEAAIAYIQEQSQSATAAE